MKPLTLDELTTLARDAEEPSFPDGNLPKPGGVDPLGLRQLNFNMMDRSLPGLNNVARRVRPFVVVAWASRQANRIALKMGEKELPVDAIRDFVDRIEVIYAWSQFLRDRNAELPGRQVLASLIGKDSYVFGGTAWKRRREERRYSTAFTAAITYGPALKALGWVIPDNQHSILFHTPPSVDDALDAFESGIVEHLDHPAFSRFGDVEVDADDVAIWGELWALDDVSPEEKATFARLLVGDGAPPARKDGIALMLAAVGHAESDDPGLVRAVMAGKPSNFVAPAGLSGAADRWRQLQIRQLFRLALEALMYWTAWSLEDGPLTTAGLVQTFQDECTAGWPVATARGQWASSVPLPGSPVTLMDRIQVAASHELGEDLAQSIADAIAFCLAEPSSGDGDDERVDRLPLSRARKESEAWIEAGSADFLRHIIEVWVLAQHVYWSVGRGMNDARSGGKTLLRLRIVMDEGGWRLAPGAGAGNEPLPTADRLGSALSLAKECGLLDLRRTSPASE